MAASFLSRFADLVREFCPNGVRIITLGEAEERGILKLGRGKIISKKEMRDYPGNYPVYSSSAIGDGEIGRYGKYMFDDERITWSVDGGGKLFYRNGMRYSVTNVGGWIKVISENFSTKFLYYVLISQWSKMEFDYTKKAHPSKIRDIYQIPLLPAPIQQEIVQVLDNLTRLTIELNEELGAEAVACRKQYEHYRDELLTFGDDVETVPIRDIVEWSGSGGTPKKDVEEYYEGGDIPWIRTQDVRFNQIYSVNSYITEKAVEKTPAKWIPENCVIVAISGATAGRCAINKIRATTNQHCLNMKIDSQKALYKYVFYCICYKYQELLDKKQGVRGDLNSTLVLDVKIPLPSLQIQQHIVSTLDQFDALCNDITSVLPIEIAARQKQYEYYRDKLLTFKELEV